MRSVRGRFADEDSPLDRDLPDRKRRRHTSHRASSWPPSKGTVVKSHHKGSSSAETRVRKQRAASLTSSKCARSGDGSRVVSSHEGLKARVQSTSGFGETVVTSVDGRYVFRSGTGNTSSATTSNEEGDSILVQNSRQTLRFGCATNPFGAGATDSFVNHPQKGPRHVERSRRISRTDQHGDGEVISPFTESVREKELNRIFGPRLWELSYEEKATVSGEMPSTASVMSRDEAGKLEKSRGRSDHSCPKRPQEDRGEGGFSSSSREYQGSSVITDLCISSCSHSVISGIRGRSYKKFRMKERSSSKEVEETPAGSTSAADEILDGDDWVDDTRERFRRSSRPADVGRDSEKQDGASESSHDVDQQSSGDDACRLPRKPPTFVLSSGRLSQEQEKELGVRPTTIDDEFERYFAQLML